MKQAILLCALVGLLMVGVTLAQDEPTPTFGSIINSDAATAVPGSASIGAAPAGDTSEVQTGADSRLATCNAHLLPGFVPYTIREGDRIGDLITGSDNITVTQLAVLNCLDDPTALPVGATIWIPGVSGADASTAASTPDVTDEAPRQAATSAGIDSFTVSADPVPNLEGATFIWDAEGDDAYFYPCPADADTDCTRPLGAQAFPVRHELVVDHFPYAGTARFRLEVVGGDETVTEDLTFEVTCSQEALGEVTGNARCPETPPLAVYGVWQPFENGVMLFFDDTEEIYVMTNGSHDVLVYQDTYSEGLAEPEYEDVPDGRFPARRGFGIVWRDLGGPDSPLGWALAEEIGYDSARQPAGRVAYTTYIQGPGDVVYAVTLLPDSSTGYWAQVSG